MKSSFYAIILALFCSIQLAQAGNSQAFKIHQKAVLKNDIQENCKPRFFAADNNIEKKGTIVALHGFSACPQQYFELIENHWTKQGYDVYTLLLPGHGVAWQDDKGLAPNIPGKHDWRQRYNETKETSIAILKESQGEKVITGLSVGGTVALWALTEYPTIIDKALIMSPYLNISKEPTPQTEGNFFLTHFKEQVFWFGATFSGNDIESWGEGCYINEREAGRAGICSFKRTVIGGLEGFGSYVLKRATIPYYRQRGQLPKYQRPLVQFVGVDKDKVAENLANFRAFQGLKKRGYQIEACLYPSRANHSLLSRFDTPNEDKFWLSSIFQNSSDFLNGHNFSTIKGSSLDQGLPECR